jgi:hypothetical protein
MDKSRKNFVKIEEMDEKNIEEVSFEKYLCELNRRNYPHITTTPDQKFVAMMIGLEQMRREGIIDEVVWNKYVVDILIWGRKIAYV